ncbi:MAG: cupin domain-containing protein [Acetobacteraceae bacterium]|nr:MAG: cupin domain-containing protein [Acetobacteraceae bacterium]
MSLIQRVSRDGTAPEIGGPAPDRLISGSPVHSTWSLEERDGLYCGLWQSTPGKWRVIYSEWEYFRILSGYSLLTGPDGHITQLHPGDSMIIRPGFEGVWEVVQTTLKDYVIRV